MNISALLAKPGKLQGILLLVIAAMLWSTSGIGIKWIEWNPMAIAGVRSGIAFLVLLACFRKTDWTFNKPILYGGISYAAMVITFVAATKLTTAANAILLQYTSPIYVAILGAIFLSEKPTRQDWLTIVLVGAGMVLFFQEQMSPGNLTGNLLAIVCAMFTAVVTVSMRSQKDNAPFGAALLGNLITFLCGVPFMFDGCPRIESWIALLLLGCFQLGLSFVLYSTAIKSVTALEAAIITMIEPLLNPLWVFLLLGEKPGFWAILGGTVILIGITARYVLPALKKVNPNK